LACVSHSEPTIGLKVFAGVGGWAKTSGGYPASSMAWNAVLDRR